jgi:hypothetical protein
MMEAAASPRNNRLRIPQRFCATLHLPLRSPQSSGTG